MNDIIWGIIILVVGVPLLFIGLAALPRMIEGGIVGFAVGLALASLADLVGLGEFTLEIVLGTSGIGVIAGLLFFVGEIVSAAQIGHHESKSRSQQSSRVTYGSSVASRECSHDWDYRYRPNGNAYRECRHCSATEMFHGENWHRI